MVRHRGYLYGKGNMLCKKFKYCSSHVKIKLFKTYCYNMYGCQLWSVFKPRDKRQLNVAFNDVFRQLFGVKRGDSISDIFVHNNIDTFNTALRKAANGFRKRLYSSNNLLICKIVSSTFFYAHSSITRQWQKELFTEPVI